MLGVLTALKSWFGIAVLVTVFLFGSWASFKVGKFVGFYEGTQYTKKTIRDRLFPRPDRGDVAPEEEEERRRFLDRFRDLWNKDEKLSKNPFDEVD